MGLRRRGVARQDDPGDQVPVARGAAGSSDGGAPLLEVRDLRVTFTVGARAMTAVDGISFAIGSAERLGVVGESGSGKSLTGLSLLGLIDTPGVRVEGEMRFGGKAYEIGGTALRELRGREISMIFQEPMRALDPVFTVGHQLREVIRRHRSMSRSQARDAAIEALASVGIPDPAKRYGEYPHQLSGGMRQRAMIALAIACESRLLIADEPTTALDVTTQAQILDLLRDLSTRNGMSVLLISHDLGVITELCDRLLCVYAGQIVEATTTRAALTNPQHPYLSGLLRAMPRRGSRGTRLFAIPGVVPPPGHMPPGCRFEPRCDFALEACRLPQGTLTTDVGGVRCHRHAELDLPGVDRSGVQV